MILSLVLANVFLNVSGQLLIKSGINRIGGFTPEGLVTFFISAFTSPYILGGLFLYGSSFFVWLVLLSKVDLSFAYPTVSLSYILILLASWLILHESLSVLRIIGVIFTTFGVFLIFRS